MKNRPSPGNGLTYLVLVVDALIWAIANAKENAMTSKETKKTEPDFLAGTEPLPYTLRGGEFGVVVAPGPDGGWLGFLLPSELKTAWDRLGSDLDGDSRYDLMELVRPGSANAARYKSAIDRLAHPKEPVLNSQ